MIKKIILVGITLLIPFIGFTQDNCNFIEKIQAYQDSVKLQYIDDLQILIDSSTFNMKSYLAFFDMIEFKEGLEINVHLLNCGSGGSPVLYALKENQKLNKNDIDNFFTLLENPDFEAKNHIIPKDSEIGSLQYLFFSEMGEQFALYWHSYYIEKYIICSYNRLLDVIDELSKSEDFLTEHKELMKLKNISPKIVIETNKKYYTITWVEYRTHSGIFKCSYKVKRNNPYSIKLNSEKRLLKINLNFIY